ncbi:hypothetical protein [Thiohalophilus sp.]|uniref:hypothetical protein n=1 Tax=Thiohalophilus sp. TaxID=3028392 RepID=UPI002ACDDA21|nr:hypothetical protein [Thiohalophilus sp.]MDZ7661904.1 hypothetical protein [Thiohalophilus sp.]MDZ7803771.1 hypothetical protein [Thiohalophilus sp.]
MVLFQSERGILGQWRRCLLAGVCLGLSAWQSVQAYSFPAPDEAGAGTLPALGLNAVQGRQASEAGAAAFEQEEYVLARRHWAPAARRGYARVQFYMGLLQADDALASLRHRLDAQRCQVTGR